MGKIRVGVHEMMCNLASRQPTPPTLSIMDQINSSPFLIGSYVSNDMIDSDAELTANYDVIYLGSGGLDLNRDSLNNAAASALTAWVTAGKGGIVTSSLSNMDLITPATILAPVLPVVHNPATYWCQPQPYPGWGLPTINVNVTAYHNHPIVRNVAAYSWMLSAWCFISPSGIASGSWSLATVQKASGRCCTSSSSCDMSQTDANLVNQAILVRPVGSGRVAWFCAPYCGYDLYQPGNLRNGDDDTVFKNALQWASGKCKLLNDCSLHGSCSGLNNCSCDSGWQGNPSCSVASCTPACVHGTCVAPNSCSCYTHWAGSDCNAGCQPGWYGPNCTAQASVQDPSFEAGAVNTYWSWSSPIRIPIIAGGARNGTYRATFSDSPTTATETVSQQVYMTADVTRPLFLTFWFMSSFVAGSTNDLQVKIDGTVVFTADISNPMAAWTLVSVNIGAFADNSVHTITFEAHTSSSSPLAAFSVDDVQIRRGTCGTCTHGTCMFPSTCQCSAHWTGPTCNSSICGDGYVISAKEQCDDGNTNNTDGCNSLCQVELGWVCTPPVEGSTSVCNEVCGNGFLTKGEICDDGNTEPLDGCSPSCTWEVGWQCTTDSPSVCSSYCGDGLVVMAEQCDDNGTAPGDGCSPTCTIESGWDCSTSNPSLCELESCQNDRKTRNEGCDDGNAAPNDGCTPTCQIQSGWTCTTTQFAHSTCNEVCGNGVVTVSEICDDGNTVDGDGCNSDCTVQAGWSCDGANPTVCAQVCGNGYITLNETCDDGNSNDTDGCNNACRVNAGWHCIGSPLSSCELDVCGNAEREPSETCDDGNTAAGDGCDSACQQEFGWLCLPLTLYNRTNCSEVCGNAVQTINEQCDDGNLATGDGCDNNCVPEVGYNCTKMPSGRSNCIRLCGNGVKSVDEDCDDGNYVSDDGCDLLCHVELGWYCNNSEPTSVCRVICGDSRVVPMREACDDGNTANGDGCSGNCASIEHGFTCQGGTRYNKSWCDDRCGDGLVSSLEACDDGNTANGDGCSGSCTVESGWVCSAEPSNCGMPGCPNAWITVGEECDDGDTDDMNGCTTQCKLMAGWDCTYLSHWGSQKCIREVCGDGRLTKSEVCDDGNTKSGDGCSEDCLKVELGFICLAPVFPPSSNPRNNSACGLEIRCGNGYKNYNEQCDDMNTVSGDGCAANCTIEPGFICVSIKGTPSDCHQIRCGDGLTEGIEQCDDGNTVSGDGCTENCTTEPGFSCIGTTCRAYCGNGIRSVTEQCDDGNRLNRDGCSSICEVESGWNCSDVANCTENCRSICASTCGDGLVASDEECDDGNKWIGDGCSSACTVEAFWKCTQEPSVCVAKRCNLGLNYTSVVHIRCGGTPTGEVRALASGLGIVSYQLSGPGRQMPPFDDVGWWVNLGPGNYTVTMMLDFDPLCTLTTVVNVSQPNQLQAVGQVALVAPSKCNTRDGSMAWKVFGGTPPIVYTLNGVNQSTGTFTGLTAMDFDIITATDANGCTIKTPANQIPPKQECVYAGFDKFIRDVWSRGGVAGVIILGATAGLVGLGTAGYCLWDSKMKKKEDAEDEAAEAAEAARYSHVDASPQMSVQLVSMTVPPAPATSEPPRV